MNTHSNTIRELIKQLDAKYGRYDVEAHTTHQWLLLRADLETYVEEYNLQAEQVADQREYQWTIDAYIKLRSGDAWMGSFRQLLSEGGYAVSEVDTRERLTHKPTLWQWEREQQRADQRRSIRKTYRNTVKIKPNTHKKKA